MNIREGVPLASYTTFGVGGSARYFVEVETRAELKDAARFAKSEGLSLFPLGGGSNILVADSGLNAVVVRLKEKTVEYSQRGDVLLAVVSAGTSWDFFVEEAVRDGWSGVENLSGIPGTVGAAPIQNIGAYGTEISHTIAWVETYDPARDMFKEFSPEECRFSYRDSIFKNEAKNLIVTRVALHLVRHTHPNTSYYGITEELIKKNVVVPTAEDIRDTVLLLRDRKGMLLGGEIGPCKTAGSFFKAPIVSRGDCARASNIAMQDNPEKALALEPWFWELPDGRVKIAPAFLMEFTPFNKTDFAGKNFNGSVGISPRHTLSLVNVGNATAGDIRAFAELIQKTVQEKFNITLEPEVSFIGEF